MIITLILAVVLGWIFGLWSNKQSYDELKVGRKWFNAIIWTCGIVLILSIIFFRNAQSFESFVGAIVFLGVLAYTGYRKSGKR